MKTHAMYSVSPIDCPSSSPEPKSPTASKQANKPGDDEMVCRYNETLQREILNELRNFNARFKDLEGEFVGGERKGLEGLVRNQELIYNKTGDGIAIVPDSWEVRVEHHRPQLVVQFAEKLSTGKLGKSRWCLHIPHYGKPEKYKPKIPSYERGDFHGIARLSDNSKIVVNAASESEARRVIKSLLTLVAPTYRKSVEIKVGRTFRDKKIEKKTVYPVRGSFFRDGAMNKLPDWVIGLE